VSDTASSIGAQQPRFDISRGGDVMRISGAGEFSLRWIAELSQAVRDLPADGRMTLDLSGVGRLDTAGAWTISEYLEAVAGAGGTIDLTGADEAKLALIESVRTANVAEDAPEPRRTPTDRVEGVGKSVIGLLKIMLDVAGYFGLFFSRLGVAIIRPREFRLTALAYHCEDVGLKAVPIVALMSFLIGVVLAFQGAAQLRQFGAEVFVVDLIAISLLRELGILLTAIIVAGRTASAFTASIGSMKMREEVDAMRTLGIDPAQALIVPRVLALILMLPILGLVANIAGLVGGGLMAWIELGISPQTFMIRLATPDNLNHAIVGFSKAPVFAILIGIVGCYCGMQVKGNAESLGMMTSKAVVASIFLVIISAAIASIFFLKVGM
jgi:phospholipid/cholesterol/gamma-HCH transport system permease protein